MDDQPELDGFRPYPKSFATMAIHHDQEPEKWDSMALVAPLVMSSTFKQYGPAQYKTFEYSRSGNPTRNVLENVLAKLDNGNYGLTFASGLAATTTILGLLKSGEQILCGDDLYGGTHRLFTKIASNFGIEVTLFNYSDLKTLENNIKKNTKVVWIEMPTNPMMGVADIKAISNITKRYNLILVVDNTFLTPYFLRPLEFGADLVSYSLTKYMNGHSDIVMGAITTANKELYDKLKYLQNAMGAVPSPFDCYQVNRGLKTLALRMKQHSKNALIVAKYLENHSKIEKVLHPGLKSHPQHELFKKQASAHSGTFSFYLIGTLEESTKFLKALKVFTLAESLGGYESLVELPSIMTHASVDAEHRKYLGISDTLIRISVGIEDVEDLIADLDQALAHI